MTTGGKLERFGIMHSPTLYSQSAKVPDLISYADTFNGKVLEIYRTITQAILGKAYLVRQFRRTYSLSLHTTLI